MLRMAIEEGMLRLLLTREAVPTSLYRGYRIQPTHSLACHLAAHTQPNQQRLQEAVVGSDGHHCFERQLDKRRRRGSSAMLRSYTQLLTFPPFLRSASVEQ